MKYLYTLIMVLALSLVVALKAHAADNTQKQLSTLNYLLAVDRLDYYSDGLADYLQDHEKAEIAAALRMITPEDYHRQMYSFKDLNDTDQWNKLVLQTLQKKYPQFSQVKLQDIDWNYNFFRKKLMEGFKADPITLKKNSVLPPSDVSRVSFEDRNIPQLQGKEILLDAERYISEKTTRGLFWDAALTGKNIEFHIGTERDFRQRVQIEQREVVAEVKTRASNYNKIYLVLDPKSGAYSYAFTRISGADRVSHLMAQLRILKFEQKMPLMKDKVRIYGNADQFHAVQEQNLTELFKTLPKADMVVIGQKSAIENVIATAGMMNQLQPDISKSTQSGDKQFNKLSSLVTDSNSYFSVTSKGNVVKSVFENFPNPMAANYEVMSVEQPSHDITDVLLEAQDGTLKRWRLISNMWGDEVVPVARALKNSGHSKVVYIGTAGAIRDKGFKVGDVAAPAQTYTQDGKLLNLETPTYGSDFVKAGKVLGQVRSPFDETDKWFAQWSPKIDLVELETGYLKDNLGKEISFQPYLLVSDIVGSEHETLAVAASDSGKRKNGQLKLLESIFTQNNIKAPVANFRPILADASYNEMFKRIDALRPSRDITSKAQLTQLALRQGLKTDLELENLIKSEPAFDRQMLVDKLEGASDALKILAQKTTSRFFGLLKTSVNYVIVGPEDLLNGTWNAKKSLKVQLMVGEMSASDAQKYLAQDLKDLAEKSGSSLEIQLISYDRDQASKGLSLNGQSENVLGSYYENVILKKAGLVKEYDKNGGIRFKPVHEFSGGMRCEAVLL